MSSLYFTICSFFVSLLLLIIFIAKEKEHRIDNTLYSGLLIFNFVDSLLMILVLLIGYGVFGNDVLAIILNKLDLIQYILWVWFFFMYTVNVCKPECKKCHNMMIYTSILNLMFIFLMIISPLYLYKNGNIMYAYGMSVNYVYFVCALYALAIIICMIVNFHKLKSKRFLPMYALGFFMIIVLIVNKINPSLLIIPAIIAYIDLIMFFTIENPDLKMVRRLELANIQAEKSNRAKSDFLSSMSHEIRTPLNAIVGLSEAIDKTDDVKEIHEDTKDILSASHNLLEIVNGILDISKIEADKIDIVECNYHPEEEFNTVIKMMKQRISKDLEIQTNYQNLPNNMYGDIGKIKQIITNLLSNSIKYTDKGYVRLDAKYIEDKLIIKISDTGRGIKKEDQDKLFTKFNRLEEDKNTTISGTGLGLAITKSLVTLLNGKIEVETEYGKGSTFTVTINQKKGDTINSDNQESMSKYTHKKVLIVDDNKLNIKVTSKILNEYELNIDSCLSGQECLDKVKNKKYDLILMDIMMPDMDGIETLNKLKEIDNFNIPVVALTADAMAGQKEKYLNDGFIDYLSKPIDRSKLNDILDSIFKVKHTNIIEPITDEQIERLNKLI